MKTAVQPITTTEAVTPKARVIFTMGGKGGVGKTSVSVLLASWLQQHDTAPLLLYLDGETKAHGSLNHFYPNARKSTVRDGNRLDDFGAVLDTSSPVMLADLGASAGYDAQSWFTEMYEAMSDEGVVFTGVGIVTPDPASVISVLSWAAFLQRRADYLIVKNSLQERSTFEYWDANEKAQEFRERFNPAIIHLEYRKPEIDKACRTFGVTLQRVTEGKTEVPYLKETMRRLQCRGYVRNAYAEFARVKDVLIP